MSSVSETPISPVGVSKPELTISAPAMNNEPVELDATPASPVKVHNARRESKAEAMSELSPEEIERRSKLISKRKTDPAVLVDIPQTPGAQEFDKSDDAEAKVSDKTASARSA